MEHLKGSVTQQIDKEFTKSVFFSHKSSMEDF